MNRFAANGLPIGSDVTILGERPLSGASHPEGSRAGAGPSLRCSPSAGPARESQRIRAPWRRRSRSHRSAVAVLCMVAAVLSVLFTPSPWRSWVRAGERDMVPQRYAIICAGAPHDAVHYRWYWGATSGMFDVLVQRYGYKPENVYFLFCDRHKGDPRVDYVATKANLEKVFRELAAKMLPGDTLFGFFVGHGTRRGQQSLYELTDGVISAKQLHRLRTGIRARTQTYVFTPCNSGGFAAVLGRQPGTVVITSCRIDEVNSAGFAEAIRDALNHAPGADADGDGRVSIGEAYNFALGAVRNWYKRRGRPLAEHPQIDDDGDGKSSFGRLPSGPHGRVALRRFLDPPAPRASKPSAATPRTKAATGP